jgi:hypothetical protein
VKVLPVELFFGCISRLNRIHLNKSEALRSARISVGNQLTRFDHAYCAEKGAEFITGSIVREISNKQFS